MRFFDVRQPAPRDNLADGEPAPGTGHILELGPEAKILLDAHFLIQRHVLRQVTDLAPDCQRLIQGVVPGQNGPPAGRGHVRRENSHRRRLPGSVGTKQADNLALSNAEADPSMALTDPYCFVSRSTSIIAQTTSGNHDQPELVPAIQTRTTR